MSANSKLVTAPTKSKVVAYAYGELSRTDYITRWNKSAEFIEGKRESLDGLLRDYRAQIVLDAKADGYTETEIAKFLNVSKQEIAKLAIRAIANAYGLDGNNAVELVNQAGNGITKVAIESIVKESIKDKATKDQIAERLQGLGLATRETTKRNTAEKSAGGATIQTRTAKAIAQLDRIAKDSIAGKLNTSRILDKLEELTAELSANG